MNLEDASLEVNEGERERRRGENPLSGVTEQELQKDAGYDVYWAYVLGGQP